jgi:hypothetical protein
LWLACVAIAAVAAGYFVGRARAGIPTTTPLFYSGYLEDTNGAVNDSKSITVNLFDAASQGNAICQSSPSGSTPTKTQVVAGRFRIALDASCTAALQSKADVWVEVNVEGQALPRSKIGAVPYALSAGNVDWGGVTGVGASTPWPGKSIYTNPQTNKTYSTNAGYCGKTATTQGKITDGALSGYPATKSLCEKACTSPSAHMCTSEELVRSLTTGSSVPAGWYSTGVLSWDGAVATPAHITDCISWTSVLHTDLGGYWATGISPVLGNDGYCDQTLPIICCD